MTPEKQEQQERLARRLEALDSYPRGRFAGRGIVICAGGASLFTNAYVLLHCLRKTLRCSLPIEIWHLGPSEMSARMVSLLEAFGARVVDVAEAGTDHAWIVDGWQLKIHALLWSSFEEVLLLDADQVPTRDPAEVFEWEEYRRTGAVLWPDAVDIVAENPIWDACGLPPRSMPAVESGQLLFDKARHWPALQVAHHLNQQADFYYRMIYGDKETYLLALLLTGSPHATVPHRPASDLGLCFYQRDFSGSVLFQHRSGAKWRYAGGQEELPGFAGREACSQALAQLRAGWNGLIFHPPSRSPRALQAESEWTALSPLAFLVAGRAHIRLELLPDGEIGEGRTPDRMNWWCEEAGGELHLVLADAFGPCWRLAFQPNRRWYGSSVGDPRVEAYAATGTFDGDGEARAPLAWRQWVWNGRYASAPDGGI